VRQGLLYSGLFPEFSERVRVRHDLSSAALVTSDYAGTVRVFLRRACLDDVMKAL